MSSHAGKTTFFIQNTAKIIPKIVPTSIQNTSKMVPKSWFGSVLGLCGRVLEPSGPENPPGCILGCENHVRGSPLGDVFWYNSGVFLCFCFVVFSSWRPERYFIDFYAILSLFSTPILEFFGARWKQSFLQPFQAKPCFSRFQGFYFSMFFSNLFRIPFRTSFFQFF